VAGGSKPVARDIGALIAFIDGRHAIPHAWGRKANDCVAFSLGAVEAQIGIKPAAALEWDDRASALRIIRKYGSLEAAYDAFFDRIPPAHAKRGDIAGVPAAAIIGPCTSEAALIGIHPMVVEGNTLCSPGERGLARAPRKLAAIAWDAASARRTARKRSLLERAKALLAGSPSGAGDV
jgi:hypothetical protein